MYPPHCRLLLRRFLRFFYTKPSILNSTFTPHKPNSVHHIEQEVRYGCGIFFVGRGSVAGPGADGLGTEEAGKASGRAVMNLLHVLYGAGGLCAVLLLAYLGYALFRAEEF